MPSAASCASERDHPAISAGVTPPDGTAGRDAGRGGRRRGRRRCARAPAAPRAAPRTARWNASETTARRGSHRPRAGELEPADPGNSARAGPTSPPSASASAWPPKHSPSTGTSAAIASLQQYPLGADPRDARVASADSSEPSDATKVGGSGSAGHRPASRDREPHGEPSLGSHSPSSPGPPRALWLRIRPRSPLIGALRAAATRGDRARRRRARPPRRRCRLRTPRGSAASSSRQRVTQEDDVGPREVLQG